MTCLPTSRDLCVFPCKMSAKSLKTRLCSSQRSIFVSFKKHYLQGLFLQNSQLKEKCKKYGLEMPLQQIRMHFKHCKVRSNEEINDCFDIVFSFNYANDAATTENLFDDIILDKKIVQLVQPTPSVQTTTSMQPTTSF